MVQKMNESASKPTVLGKRNPKISIGFVYNEMWAMPGYLT